MFNIKRYEVGQEQKLENTNTVKERLSRINERVQLKRKRKDKKKTVPIEQTLANEAFTTPNEKNNKNYVKIQKFGKNYTEKVENDVGMEIDDAIENPLQVPPGTEKRVFDVEINESKDKKHSKEEGVKDQAFLEAFPSFEKPPPSSEDLAAIKRLGIPNWLAYPTTIDSELVLPVRDPSIRLSKKLIDRCESLGIKEFFAVQTAVIPILLRSRDLSNVHQSPGDLCISAPTGSGKTLAYVLPIIEILSKRVVTRLRALIVLPTRDLVGQVKETFDAFCKGTGLKIGVVTGQSSFVNEQNQIIGNMTERLIGGSSKVDILIATPGRLIDHLKSTPNFTLQYLRFLIIDEADRLLNQSYQEWLTHILEASQPDSQNNYQRDLFQSTVDSYEIPLHDAVAPTMMSIYFRFSKSDITDPPVSSIQKLLFSATLTRNPEKIASLRLINPQYISVQLSSENCEQGIKYTLPSRLKEYMIVVSSLDKPLIFLHLLHNYKISSALCFTKSVDSAHRLAKLIQLFESAENRKERMMNEPPMTAVEYSSDLSQAERNTILNKFKSGDIQLLICSDLIARGIDLDRVDAVINYDVPIYMKKYVHRVGRTARAGRDGDAYTLVETHEARHFKDMLSKAGHLQKIKKINIQQSVLEPMKDTYQKSLNALREYMVDGKTSLEKYQHIAVAQQFTDDQNFCSDED